MNLPAVPSLLSTSPVLFLSLETGAEADEQVCFLKSYHIESNRPVSFSVQLLLNATSDSLGFLLICLVRRRLPFPFAKRRQENLF